MPAKRVPCRPSAADSDLVIQIPLKISCTQVIQIDPKVSGSWTFFTTENRQSSRSAPRKHSASCAVDRQPLKALVAAPLIDSL